MQSQPNESTDALRRVLRTVLVVDLVESVRLIEQDEEETVRRWRELETRVRSTVLPQYGGRLVKSLGDGLMLEFSEVLPAIRAAVAIQELFRQSNDGFPAARHMLVRIGIHVAHVIRGEQDIYGHGINLAARLASLAGPAETVVSPEVRDALGEHAAGVEDLGECYLKHFSSPIRAYRLRAAGSRRVIPQSSAVASQLKPVIAVVPFRGRTSERTHRVLGDVLADDVIRTLSRSSEFHVISRLSTGAFRNADAPSRDIGQRLKATYVLSGAYRVSGNQLILSAELAETLSGNVVWSQCLKGTVRGVISGDDDCIHQLLSAIRGAIFSAQLNRARTGALPNLETHTLLFGGISLLHRLNEADFKRSREMLEAVTERAPRQATSRAWLAQWHVMRVQQGWSDDPQQDGKRALECTRRALDNDPECSLALAMDGLVHTTLLKRFDIAGESFERALEANPNDSLAWLLRGTLHAFKGEGDQAVQAAEHALTLSPLDPLRSYYDSLAATAALSAGLFARAVVLARRSLQSNRTHTSTLRALAIAQWQLGHEHDAKATVAELRRLEPRLTVTEYLQRSPSSTYETGGIWSRALKSAGLPA